MAHRFSLVERISLNHADMPPRYSSSASRASSFDSAVPSATLSTPGTSVCNQPFDHKVAQLKATRGKPSGESLFITVLTGGLASFHFSLASRRAARCEPAGRNAYRSGNASRSPVKKVVFPDRTVERTASLGSGSTYIDHLWDFREHRQQNLLTPRLRYCRSDSATRENVWACISIVLPTRLGIVTDALVFGSQWQEPNSKVRSSWTTFLGKSRLAIDRRIGILLRVAWYPQSKH